MSGRGEGFAGALRERVTIARQLAGSDALGGADGAWGIIATRRAAVSPDGIGEAVVGEATSAAARFSVTMRAGIEVVPGDRLGWRGRTFRVRAVIADPAMPDRIMLRVEELR